MFKSRREILSISGWSLLFIIWINLFSIYFLKNYNVLDLKFFDYLLKQFYKQERNDRLCYLVITDNSYKSIFKKNSIDRKKIAAVLNSLKSFGAEKILLDILFLHPSDPESDKILSKSIENLDIIVHPVAINRNFDESKLTNLSSVIVFDKIFQNTKIKDDSSKIFLFPYPKFFFDEQPFGHISDLTDDDGIIRHSNLFLIYDSVFVPSLAFATYLSLMYSDQPSMKITLQKNFIGNNAFFQIQKDSLFIPLDDEGKTFIPFVAKWGEDFDLITVENFFQTIKSENGFNKLKEYFNGKIVIIGDVSTGSSDLRSTPMDQVAPLIMLHSAMLNSLINKSFLKKINLNIFLIIINVCFILLYLSQIVKVKNLFSVVFITLIFLELIGSIILIILGFVIPFFSLLICNVIYFTFGFLNLQFIINKERKILEIDYLRKSYEMSETRKIQNSLLPKVPYNLDGYDIGFMIQTAEEVGGDFYDIFNEDDCLTLFIADGSGHGLQAGTLVIFLKTILTSTRDYKDPKLLFHKINNTLCSIKLNKLFLCLTMIKIKKDYVEYITAGMPPILHYKFSEKKVYQYRNKNLSLGLKKDFSFVSDTIKVDSGDLLFLASDGLYELFNHKKEMLEIERVSQFIYNNAKLNSNEIVNNLKLFISNWIGKQAQADDISSVIIKKIS